MGVDAAEAESAHRRPPRGIRVAAFPGLAFGLDPKRPSVQRAFRRSLSKMKRRRQNPMLHGQQHLDHAGCAGGRQQMPDHGFDRADGALGRPPSGIAPETPQARQLGGIAHGSPGTVALDQVDIRGRPVGGGIRGLHGPELAFRVRGQQVPAQVVGKADPPDQTPDAVTLPQRVFQALEHQQPGTLADHQAVGIPVEGGTAPRGERARNWLNPTWVKRQSGRATRRPAWHRRAGRAARHRPV